MRNNHILIATDFSDAWTERLPDISSMFKSLGSTISVVHVITSAFKLWLKSDALEMEAQERLEHWLSLMREEGISTGKALVRTGSAAEEVLVAADLLSCDIIMIAADPKRTFLGSTAEAVVRGAQQSVWVYHTKEFRGIKRIVCASDMSAPSAKALLKAASLARECSAVLDVLYCIEVPDTNTLGMSKQEASERYEQYKARAAQEFDAFVYSTLGSAYTPDAVRTRIVWGKPSATIVNHTADSHADLIVMGAKGTSNLQLLTIGSTTHNILRTAKCSLFVVR